MFALVIQLLELPAFGTGGMGICALAAKVADNKISSV
jgi:hypothetical protein